MPISQQYELGTVIGCRRLQQRQVIFAHRAQCYLLAHAHNHPHPAA
jgi:hypothetical protein